MNGRSRRSFFQRLERRLVGLVMAIMAYGLEKSILRSIRSGGAKSPSCDASEL
ncbi:hypothetical protein [Methylococcus geothermalis]|uniref:Uncharacterized protein n=1 Tax=Methylococcus geothermalis TaxID=2681310 RepID=A0A858QB85_9GAMM|nr:hypothetical protein [Methylococcus geothermalis]QJD31159.1 hypothetical protein GNH96_15230 [Methylococcus geothermalis]